jgi:hypothetical protein
MNRQAFEEKYKDLFSDPFTSVNSSDPCAVTRVLQCKMFALAVGDQSMKVFRDHREGPKLNPGERIEDMADWYFRGLSLKAQIVEDCERAFKNAAVLLYFAPLGYCGWDCDGAG